MYCLQIPLQILIFHSFPGRRLSTSDTQWNTHICSIISTLREFKLNAPFIVFPVNGFLIFFASRTPSSRFFVVFQKMTPNRSSRWLLILFFAQNTETRKSDCLKALNATLQN